MKILILEYLKAFLVGGLICLIGQILIDKTRLTPARILVSYVVLGVVLTGLGVYGRLVDFAGAGAFGVMPMQKWLWRDGTTTLSFADVFSDFSRFSKLSLYVRNDSSAAITFDGVRVKMATMGLDATSECTDGTIPADGEWHRIVLDLNNLEDFIGNKFDKSYLAATSKIQFLFEGTAAGSLLIDQIEWIP